MFTNGTATAVDTVVGLTNLLLHNLFSQVDVFLNDKLIFSSSNTYAYRAYLETLMNYGTEAKESQLTASLCYKDTANYMDEASVADDRRNRGLVNRTWHTIESSTVDFIGRLHCDLFFQEKLLLNGINVRIRLVRSKDAFCIMAARIAVVNPIFKIRIENAILRVRKVRLSDTVFLALAKALEFGNAKYPSQRVECKTFSIPAQSLDITQENVFLGHLPTCIIIGCVDNDAFNGRYIQNSFNFKHYNINRITVQVDGLEQPVKPLECNFDERNIAQAYMSLFQGMGKAYKDDVIDVAREEYICGYTLFAST